MTSQRPYRYIRQIPWELLSLCNASFARAIRLMMLGKRMNCVLMCRSMFVIMLESLNNEIVKLPAYEKYLNP